MKGKVAQQLHVLIALLLILGCGHDTPTAVTLCPPGSEAREIEVWRDRAILLPRTSSKELLSPALWHGISRTMTRTEVESLLAAHLRSRTTYWSDFETPLGRLRWSLDREFSGGIEARIPRVYLFPSRLSLKDVLAADVLSCLRMAAPNARYVIVMRSTDSRLATVVVDGQMIERVIWRQASE